MMKPKNYPFGINRLFGVLAFCSVCVVGLTIGDAQQVQPKARSTTATLISKKHEETFPSPYAIKVDFSQPVEETIIRRSLFRIFYSNSVVEVPFKAARPVGGSTEENTNLYSHAEIFGSFSPNERYRIRVNYPNTNFVEIGVTNAAKLPTAALDHPLYRLKTHHLHFEINPFTAEASGSLGIKYDASINFPSRFLNEGTYVRFDAESAGELSTKSDDPKIQNSLKLGASGKFLHNFGINVGRIPFSSDTNSYEFAYPIGINLKPAEMELNKQFSVVDYTMKLQGGGAIPFIDYPMLFWNRAFKLDVPVFPPTLFTGYSYVKDIKNSAARMARPGQHRWDTELLYDFPLANQLDVRFSWQAFKSLENGMLKTSTDVGILIYLQTERTSGFTISYQKGSLPPEFKETSSWRLGYIAKF